MIFGAKIQIFQKLTIELKKCHFWRENSNETILRIFMHCAHLCSTAGSKVQGRLHPEDVSMRNEPRYAQEMSLRDFSLALKNWGFLWR